MTKTAKVYSKEELASAVSAFLVIRRSARSTLTVEDSMARAAAVMLHKLGDYSEGAVIFGCCTQTLDILGSL